jgi:hypothetical protein
VEEVTDLEQGAAGMFLSWLGKLPGFCLRLAVIEACTRVISRSSESSTLIRRSTSALVAATSAAAAATGSASAPLPGPRRYRCWRAARVH